MAVGVFFIFSIYPKHTGQFSTLLSLLSLSNLQLAAELQRVAELQLIV
jgi:hypothetical protein